MVKQENIPASPLWDMAMEMVSELPDIHVCALSNAVNLAETHYALVAKVHWLDPYVPAELRLRQIQLTSERPLGAPLPDLAHHILASMGDPQPEKPVNFPHHDFWRMVDHQPQRSMYPGLRRAVVKACTARARRLEYHGSDSSLGWLEAYIDDRNEYEVRRVTDEREIVVSPETEHTDGQANIAELVIRLASILRRDTLPFHPAFTQIKQQDTRHPRHIAYLSDFYN